MTTQERQLPSDTSTFESMHRDFTVDRVDTPRDELEYCTQEETIAAVRKRNTKKYNYLPVKDCHGSIIGLFHALPEACTTKKIVGDDMDGLSDANLIGADASILDFLKEVDTKPFRLVVSGSGIHGLMAWSDLQKLPVRTALFGLITGFELTMFEAIKSKYPAGEDWLAQLTPGRRENVSKEIKKAHKSDSDVDALLYTQFCDKTAILKKCFGLEKSKRIPRQDRVPAKQGSACKQLRE